MPTKQPGHEVIRVVKRCRIHQIEPPDGEFAYMDLSSVHKKVLTAPPANLYRIMFDGQLNTDNPEDIFRIFNLKHPPGYTGRSLSISDIVEFYDENGSRFYYCDTVGFEEVPFKPDDQERP